MATSTYFATSLSGAVTPFHKSQSCYKKPYCSLSYSSLIVKSNKFSSINCSTISSRSNPIRGLKSSTLAASGLWGSKLLVKTSCSSTSAGGAGVTIALQANEGIFPLVIAVAAPFVLGAANALVNNPTSSFYKDLKKPSYNPPDWLLGMELLVLYPLMGLASWLVWSEGGFNNQAYPLAAYGVQLVINLLWPPIFFSAHKIRLALIVKSALLVAVGVTAVLFKPVNPLAAYLLIPYLAWTIYAILLNYDYLALNGSTADQP